MFRIYGKAFLPRQDHIALRPTAAKKRSLGHGREKRCQMIARPCASSRSPPTRETQTRGLSSGYSTVMALAGCRRIGPRPSGFSSAPPARDTLGRGYISKIMPQECQQPSGSIPEGGGRIRGWRRSQKRYLGETSDGFVRDTHRLGSKHSITQCLFSKSFN